MPIIRVEMHEGRTVDQKRALAAALTDAIVEHADAKREAVRVIFTDYSKDDWAIAGQLVSDRERAAAEG
jgi:4-oxalocrotonate tautomerase